MAKATPVMVELSPTDRRLLRDLIAAIRDGYTSDEPEQPSVKDSVKRLVEGSQSVPYRDADGRLRYHY